MNPDKNVKVSVVVITYNQEDTIGRTLDSILSQTTDFNFEIIIGDDASTDNTGRICEDYARRFPDIIRYVRNEKNKGIINNYYDCILMAQGEYIADLAGDDAWIRTDKLKKQAEILDIDHEVVLVHTDWQYFNSSDSSVSSPWKNGYYPYPRNAKKGELTELILKHSLPNVIHLCTSMYRKSTFLEVYNEDKFLFRNTEFMIEDFQLEVMMAEKGKIIFIDDVTLNYTLSDKNTSAVGNPAKSFDLYYSSMLLTRYLENKLDAKHELMIPVYQRFLHYLLMQAFHLHDKSRRDKVINSFSEWEVPLTAKSKIISFLSSRRISWKIARKLWHSIKGYDYPISTNPED